MDAIKTTNLTKYYGKARGIIDVNLAVKKGEFFGFIGPNGAGKSTTIRALLGLINSTGGEAEILGMNIKNEQQEILSKIGYLPSESVFYSGMRVRDILKLSADLRKQNCREEAERLCEQFQLDTSRKVDELSFGNRKKMSIICALQHKPELLILDEPTSGLDPLMQRVFFDTLRERNQDGTTIFLSSHVLSEIQRNCSRAAIIREGRIIACDTVEALSKTTAKRVTVHSDTDLSTLTQLDGIRDFQTINDGASFLYGDDINRLIQILSQNHITDLSVAEPDLEEIFMHYYADGGEV